MSTVLSDYVEELTTRSVQLRKRSKWARNGQSLMLVLRDYDKAAYRAVIASDADPFYVDDLIPAFWMKLGEYIQAKAEKEAINGGQAEAV